MISAAMQTMAMNMLRDFLSNLPEGEKQKISQTIDFVASLDTRLTAIEATLLRIEQRNGDIDVGRNERPEDRGVALIQG